MSTRPSAAPLSYAIAAIPREPLYSSVARASLAVAAFTENRNLIDNVQWPCHLSLLLGGTTKEGAAVLGETLRRSLDRTFSGTAARLYTGSRGFIGIALEGPALVDAHRAAAAAAEAAMLAAPVVRPHLLRRWERLREEERSAVLRYGSYKIDSKFDAHLSVAQVDEEDQREAFARASRHLTFPTPVEFGAIHIVDVGDENERWIVQDVIALN